jgi:hypothetical protein
VSKTRVDMAKVTQMLDAGWVVQIQKCALGSYAVRAKHPDARRKLDAVKSIYRSYSKGDSLSLDDYLDAHCDGTSLITDDFTPEQALTRMAYKVHGEII